MITSARIEALRELAAWAGSPRHEPLRSLPEAADNGPLQISLFDQANLAEIRPKVMSPRRVDDCSVQHPCLVGVHVNGTLAVYG